MSAVVFSGVTKSFGSTLVIPNLDLTVESGSFTVLVGPSGCGKSTVLRMIAGLEDVSSGRISIDGEDVTDLGVVRGSEYRQSPVGGTGMR